jgi:hypothetical protein
MSGLQCGMWEVGTLCGHRGSYPKAQTAGTLRRSGIARSMAAGNVSMR